MRASIQFSDENFPLSPAFIDFAAHWLDKVPFKDYDWSDQVTERLSKQDKDIKALADDRLERMLLDEKGRFLVETVYRWFVALTTADVNAVRSMRRRFKFIHVVGIPRNGGSFLTNELYRSLGRDSSCIPPIVAHDGFPSITPFSYSKRGNSWIGSIRSLAEYFTVIECFFSDAPKREGKVIVPKKLTKGAYAGALFSTVLGKSIENIFTIRHPAACCASTYDKSGGYRDAAVFRPRSAIEKWMKRDAALFVGVARANTAQDYFETYLQYWESYHINVAMSGFNRSRCNSVIVYGKERMERLANGFHSRFESGLTTSTFIASEHVKNRHPQWLARSEPVVARIADLWSRVGLHFELNELMECN